MSVAWSVADVEQTVRAPTAHIDWKLPPSLLLLLPLEPSARVEAASEPTRHTGGRASPFMRASAPRLASPVVTFLSPSAGAAARACERIAQWSAVSTRRPPETRRRWGISWEFHALECSETGTTLQYMASTRSSATAGQHCLIAVQDFIPNSAFDSKEGLLTSLSATKSQVKILLSGWIGRSVSVQSLLGSGLTPLIDLRVHSSADSLPKMGAFSTNGVLKEVSLPFFDSGPSLLQPFSALPRLAVGLYQLHNGLAVRPLPASEHDHELPPSTLVFHMSSMEPQVIPADSETSFARIGCSGVRRQGQTMVRHADTRGLDIRFCASTEPSSVFCEAQESLFASSLRELQSTNVLQSTGQVDPRTLQMDCWVEFRANLARPRGFLKKNQPRIAKAPDLPFE